MVSSQRSKTTEVEKLRKENEELKKELHELKSLNEIDLTRHVLNLVKPANVYLEDPEYYKEAAAILGTRLFYQEGQKLIDAQKEMILKVNPQLYNLTPDQARMLGIGTLNGIYVYQDTIERCAVQAKPKQIPFDPFKMMDI